MRATQQRVSSWFAFMAGIFAWLSLFAGQLTGVAAALAASRPEEQPPATDYARLWQAYAARFISNDGRVVDPMREGMTTSEGQSYALFFALVNNDRAHFESLLAWTESNLTSGDLGAQLPAWSWGKAKDGHWGVLDPNSASDSDLWIAYDLIEAGRLWTGPNALHYATLGRRLAALIARKEVTSLPGFGPVLLPGEAGFKFPRFWVLNPSYTPLFLLERLAAVDPAGPWADVAMEVPALLERSAKGGFAFDWVCYTPGEGFTPCLANGQKTPAPVGSYDAIRVYLWAGMLPDSSPAKARILKALPGMNSYLQHNGAPPEKINSDGSAQAQAGPVGFSAALLPYLRGNANETAVAQQMVRLKSQLDEKSNLYGSSPTYYDQNLALFGSGWIEQRFQFGSSGELRVRWSR
jgi:endo-1,4-beta-D-glucanase Y